VIVDGRRIPGSPWFWRTLARGLAVVGVVTGAVALYAHLTVDPLADAEAYYLAATRLNEGQPLYPAWIDSNVAAFYRYPPLLAVVLRPVVAVLSFDAFRLVWEALVLASFGLLLRRVGLTRRTAMVVAILGVPVAFALSVGQAHVPLTLLLAIGAPWSVAVAANLKLFPLLVAVYWLGRRDWAALRRLGLWLVILAAVQFVLEPTGSLAYLPSLFELDQVGRVRNLSPYELSPILWAVLAAAGLFLALRLAPGRWGWPAAVALATLTPPRLLSYMLVGLLAALRDPGAKRAPGAPGAEGAEGAEGAPPPVAPPGAAEPPGR
jgi:hypothetical protein